MKIVHTADWHLGKKLHEIDFLPDQTFFLKWLLEWIDKNEVDALLVSGDIFDQANPSRQAEKLYFEFLVDLSKTTCRQVIITGGNHDSVQTLEAPASILRHLNVTIVGGMPQYPEDEVIELQDSKNNIKGVVCATPYLRDKDIYKSLAGQSYVDRIAEVKNGIVNHYGEMAAIIEKQYQGLPVIGMGHLFVQGVSEVSEAVRDIQIGNLAGVEAGLLPKSFDYIALGHIHRKQKLKGHPNTWYSGSPYPLSFTERDYHHCVLLVELKEDGIGLPQEIEIPTYRKLLSLKIPLTELEAGLTKYDTEDNELSLAELIVETDTNMIGQNHLVESIIDALKYLTIIKYKISQRTSTKDEQEVSAPDLQSFTPKTVFSQMLEDKYEGAHADRLMAAFNELTESMHQKEPAE